jgi:hypothetical protein
MQARSENHTSVIKAGAHTSRSPPPSADGYSHNNQSVHINGNEESGTDFDIPLMPLGTIPGFGCGVLIIQEGY